MPKTEPVNVLVVDSDVASAQELARILKGQNYLVHTANGAEDAMQLLEQSDILWLSVPQNPNGQSARVVLSEWIRTSDGPICISSDDPTATTEHEMLLRGVDNVLSKPTPLEVVSTVVARYARRVKRDRRLDTLELDARKLKWYLAAITAIALSNGALDIAGFGIVDLITNLF